MKAKRLIIRLYFIHLFAGLAIALSMYFAGFDIVLSLVYVIINVREVLTKLKFAAKVKAIILWQLPGIIASIASVAAVGGWGQANYAFFILEFFYTPLLPLLTILTNYSFASLPLYYYLLLSMPFLLIAFYCTVIKLQHLIYCMRQNAADALSKPGS